MCPCKARNRRTTNGISRFRNAARVQKDRQDAVRDLFSGYLIFLFESGKQGNQICPALRFVSGACIVRFFSPGGDAVLNFNSLQYYLFLPGALLAYFALPARWKNRALLLLSYFFYMCWEARYALLMLLSTCITYWCALLTERRALGRHKLWVVLSLLINLGILFFFKYFNFTAALISDLLTAAGLSVSPPALRVLLPVGISFYTFQALGYTIDVYRGDMAAERRFSDYALFVSFFPQLVAGPIERSGNLLPQLKQAHRFSFQNLHHGAVYVLWGLFKKIAIADWMGVLADGAYGAPLETVTGAQYLVGTVAFALQIYCDFSAYSDIAVGSARMLGIRLMRNFDAPYLALSIRDFWRRWHISLSSWFKDYLFFPMGGSRGKTGRTCLNLLVLFAVSGLWHGADLTFVAWGLINGLYMAAGTLLRPVTARLGARLAVRRGGRLLDLFRWLVTLLLTCFSWIFFRAASLSQALAIVSKIARSPFSGLSLAGISQLGLSLRQLGALAVFTLVLFGADFFGRGRNPAEKISGTVFLRYAVYLALIAACLIFGYYGPEFDPRAFQYFQF